MRIFHLVTALSVALAGCAGGPRIDDDQLSQLRTGETTVTAVTARFGRPSILSKNVDGTQTATYYHSDAPSGGNQPAFSFGAANADTVVFYFDTNGVLTGHKAVRAAARTTASVAVKDAPQANPKEETAPVTSKVPAPGATTATAPVGAPKSGEAGTVTLKIPAWPPTSDRDVRR